MTGRPAHGQEAQPTPELEPPRIEQFREAVFPEGEVYPDGGAEVLLELTLDVEGRVLEAAILESQAGPRYGEAARAAAMQWRFVPAKRGGQPVAARIRYRYVFEPPIPPAEFGALFGQVLDAKNGLALEGVGVTLELVGAPPDDAAKLTAVTDEQGRFAFAELGPGTYRVTLRAQGFESRVQNESVRAGEAVELTYRLNASRATQPSAGAVTFEATAVVDPPPREAIRRSIREEELTRVAGTRGDALRTVELLPGVGRPPFGAGALIVRGSAPQDSEIFLNGHPIPLLYHFGGITSFINGRLLSQIDFYPGNFSARYGRKTGGVLEVATRNPKPALSGVADINLLDASVLVEGPLSDETTLAVAARRSYVDLFLQQGASLGAIDLVAAPVYWDYQLALSHRASPRDEFRLVAFGSSDRLRGIFSEPQDDDPSFRGNLGVDLSFHRLYAEWTRTWSPDLEHDLSFSAGPTFQQFELGPDLLFDATFIQLAVRAEWRLRLSSAVRLIGGVDAVITPFSIDFRGPQPGQQEGAPQGNPLATQDLVDIETEGVAFRPAAYLESDLRPTRKLQVVLGLRLDWFAEIERWAFDPRATLIYSIDEATRIKAGVGMFSQPPEFQESNPDVGNPDLHPIRALHLGLGADHTLAEGISIGVEGFFKNLDDRPIETRGRVPPFFRNAGTGRICGLEVSGRIEPRGRRAFGFLSYTLSRSTRQDGENTPRRLFDFDQTHILTIAGSQPLGRGWQVGATFRFVSGNPLTPVVGGIYNANADLYQPLFGDINSRRNAPFHRLDLRVEKMWTFRDWRLAAYLDVQNVYNRANQEGVVYNFDFTERDTIQGLPILPVLGVRGEL